MKESICQHCNKLFTPIAGSYGKFCSLSCSNFYRAKKVKLKLEENYNKNPVYCNYCKEPLHFSKKKNKFCSSSCSAKASNQITYKKIINQDNRNHNIFEKRQRGPKPKEKLIYSKIKFLFCEKTKQWYSNRNIDGSYRRCSPYIKGDKEKYYNAARFKFNVYHYPEEFNIQLIEETGWYTCPGKKRKNGIKNINGVSRDHIISVSYGYKNNIDPSIIAHPANCRIILQSENKKKSGRCSLTLEQLLERIKEWNEKYTERMTRFELATNSLEG